ncbi:MAG: TetR/AcrR family transcriptional regulator [Sporolactobacillus sp.]
MAEDLRTQKTKAQIKQTFIELLLEKNFMKITVRDITESAKIGRGTFYLHYQDKFDLLQSVMNEGTMSITNNVRPAYLFEGGKINPERVKGTILSVYSYFQKNERFYRALLFNEGIPSFRQRLQQQMIGKFYDDVPAVLPANKNVDPITFEILPQFISSGMLGLIGWWFENDLQVPIEVIARNVEQILTQISFILLK